MKEIQSEVFTKQLMTLLGETFDKVAGIYLDKDTSLFETLGGIDAATASRPVAPGATTIAGQVEHIRFYLKVLEDYMKGELEGRVDWKQSWLVSTVNNDEWVALVDSLREAHGRIMELLRGVDNWNDQKHLGGALGVLAHTAYHLGAIRQMLRVVATT